MLIKQIKLKKMDHVESFYILNSIKIEEYILLVFETIILFSKEFAHKKKNLLMTLTNKKFQYFSSLFHFCLSS